MTIDSYQSVPGRVTCQDTYGGYIFGRIHTSSSPRQEKTAIIRTRWPCVEITHTTGWEERDRDDDDLSSYAGLLRWAVREGLLDERTGDALAAEAEARPAEAGEVLGRARDLRGALYRVLTSVARDRTPPAGALATLNRELERAAGRLRLEGSGREYDLELDPAARSELQWPLLVVSRSAAELLTSDEVERLHLCDAHDCGWLFIDASRNRSRRWCDMSDCGNRAKARRYRKRHGE